MHQRKEGIGEAGHTLARTLGFGMRALFIVPNMSLPLDTIDPCVLIRKQGPQGFKACSTCQEVWPLTQKVHKGQAGTQ